MYSWDSQVEAMLQVFNEGGILGKETQAGELGCPCVVPVGGYWLKPSPPEGTTELRGMTFRSRSICVSRDGRWIGNPWGAASRSTGGFRLCPPAFRVHAFWLRRRNRPIACDRRILQKCARGDRGMQHRLRHASLRLAEKTLAGLSWLAPRGLGCAIPLDAEVGNPP